MHFSQCISQCLDQCPLKNIKKQRYRLGMVAHSFNPSTQETRRGRRRRKTRRKKARMQRKGWRRRRRRRKKRKRRKKGSNKGLGRGEVDMGGAREGRRGYGRG